MRWPWKHASSPASDHRFGYAVVGLGHGALKFLEALRGSPTVRVAALVSRDAMKAQGLARRFHVPSVYAEADFDQIAHNPAIHAVYLCLPNALHRRFAERAAAAGKHVLCEKPLAPNLSDANAIVDACQASRCRLMTGYRLDFSPLHQQIATRLAAGDFGEVTGIRSGFGFLAKPGWRLDPALAGGGSLLDVGIYAIRALHTFFPEGFSVESARTTCSPDTGMEMATTWTGHLNNSASAPIQCTSSYLEKIPDHFEITTTKARLALQPAFGYRNLKLRLEALLPKNSLRPQTLHEPRGTPSLFRLEGEHFAARIRDTTEPRNYVTGLQELFTIEKILTCS